MTSHYFYCEHKSKKGGVSKKHTSFCFSNLSSCTQFSFHTHEHLYNTEWFR